MRSLLALSLGLLVSACYNPKIPNGTQTCAANNVCASGYTCAYDNHCYVNGQPPPMPYDLSTIADLSVAIDMATCTPATCSGATPFCNATSGLCVACISDSQCPDGQLCQMNACAAGCSLTRSCGDAGVCDVDAGMCKFCHMDADCTDPNNSRCEVTNGRCVPCQPTNDNCGNNQFCVANNGSWQCQMGCKVDNDCAAAGDGGGGVMVQLSCCNHLCVDVTGDANNCGKCGTACANGGSCCASACTDTTQDASNCGKCGAACGGKNANWACMASACAISSCTGTFRDCNMNPSDGCEANIISDPMNCLGCGKICMAPNGVAVCNQACAIGMCNPGYADCDKISMNGCEVADGSDIKNCGGCGRVCAVPANGSASCINGTCGIESCNQGYADCDGNALNGCEVNLANNVSNCGVCKKSCVEANASSSCVNGTCSVGVCNQGFADCNANPADGCEVNTNSDINNCGGCKTPCTVANGTPSCANAVCGIASCNAGFANCSGSPKTGCETNTNSDINNCGGCKLACSVANDAPSCNAGKCVLACNPGFGDCNHNAADGCEDNLNTDASNCNTCGNVCPNGGSCTNGVCGQYGDWLVGSPCNGVDDGGGCTPAETGYHYKGPYNGYQCWWHTKNQAWNTTVNTNIYQLAVHFGLTPANAVEQWCFAFAATPAPLGYQADYDTINNIGAWGWCGGAPFTSGGWVCIK